PQGRMWRQATGVPGGLSGMPKAHAWRANARCLCRENATSFSQGETQSCEQVGRAAQRSGSPPAALV
ncbi:hypothetical protein, partial [Brasilonema octagenarum]